MFNKLKKIENNIWSFIDKHKILIFWLIITLCALILRAKLFDYQSMDYKTFLKPWFEKIKEGGGLSALNQKIGNYTAPYMTILAILTYLPINSLYSIKVIAVIFDFICAIVSAQIVKLILKDNKNKDIIALIIYGAVLFLPTVFLNSACWAQADQIYTAFILISILFLLKEKYINAFIFLGISLSFKIQCIFILPLYILMYISEKKISIVHFVIPFLTIIVMNIPSFLFGNTLKNCIDIYTEQVGSYASYISLNFPNVYSIFFKPGSSNLISMTNSLLNTIAVMLTIFIFIIISFVVLHKKIKFEGKAIIEFGLWSILICAFFLPHMHERYLYIGDILSLIFLIYNKEKFYIPIGIEMVSLYGYLYILFRSNEPEMKYFGITYLIIIILYSNHMIKNYFINENVDSISKV